MGNLKISLLVALFSTCLGQDISLNNYFSDGMVFQRDTPNKIWGYGTLNPDQPMSVQCVLKNGAKRIEKLNPVQVSADGWEVDTSPQTAFVRCTFTFSENLILADVLYGDVWLCSGQSNMEQSMANIENATEEIEASASYYDIRYAIVANQMLTEADSNHNQEMQLQWSRSDNSEALKYMSAVCYLFARNVYDVTGVPMGVFSSDWGGTRVEAWSSPEALQTCSVPEDNTQDANAQSVLWNGMINPLLRISLKGFLWYQGEANGYNNRDLYNCTFPTMINDWRLKFSENSGTYEKAPFGFVQLSTWRADILDLGFPVIRWHQTADIGVVPNFLMQNVFMSTPLDTYDPKDGYPGNIHPRYKQIAAERLAYAGLNVAYGYEQYPKYGPYPFSIEPNGNTVTIKFQEDIDLTDSEISGFHFCAESMDACDAGTQGDKWIDVPKGKVTKTSSDTLDVDLADFGDISGGSISYIWRETPVKELYMLPLYSTDGYRVPTPPFKFQL